MCAYSTARLMQTFVMHYLACSISTMSTQFVLEDRKSRSKLDAISKGCLWDKHASIKAVRLNEPRASH